MTFIGSRDPDHAHSIIFHSLLLDTIHVYVPNLKELSSLVAKTRGVPTHALLTRQFNLGGQTHRQNQTGPVQCALVVIH